MKGFERDLKRSVKTYKIVNWGIMAAICLALFSVGAIFYGDLDGKLDSKLPIILEQSKQISEIREQLRTLSTVVSDLTETKKESKRRILNSKVNELEKKMDSADKRIRILEEGMKIR